MLLFYTHQITYFVFNIHRKTSRKEAFMDVIGERMASQTKASKIEKLTALPGVGVATAKKLVDAKLDTVSKVAAAGASKLIKAGIKAAVAKKIASAAKSADKAASATKAVSTKAKAAAKKAPAKGQPPPPDEPAPPRMITPPAVIMENESGRTFRLELGRMEKEPLSQEQSVQMDQPSQDVSATKDSK